MKKEQANANENSNASLMKLSGENEMMKIEGNYEVVCKDKNGKIKWKDTIKNLVATVGKNSMLDNFLAGSSYSVVGPFMGLISSVSYSAIAAADTMSSHAGWTEAGITNAPTYSGGRPTAAFSSASAGSKSLSSALTFTFTGTGTVKGCFIALGSGAVATVDNTSGTLFSAGLFTGGDKAVIATDILSVSYSASL